MDQIEGLSPAISIDQKGVSANPRSTVGTVTEIYDYMRLLYARVGIPHCPVCGERVVAQSAQQMVEIIEGLPEGTRLQLLAPVIKDRKGKHDKVFDDLRKGGFMRARVDGDVHDLEDDIKLARYEMHTIEVVVDRLIVKHYDDPDSDDAKSARSRLTDSVETALGWSIPFSIAEGVAGYMISDGYQLSEGDVAMITNGGVLGLGVGIGMTHLAGFVDIGDEHAAGLLILGGSAGGLLLGNAMANAQTYTTGDASVVASTALLGGFTPLFFAELIDPDQNDTDGKLHIGGVMLGATAGMLLGGELVREKDFTPSQATSIGLGEIAGGLLGAGLAYLVVPESSSDDLAVYLGAGSIGAIGGFAIAYNRMAKEARTTTAEEHGFLYDFDISPSGLAALMSGSDIPENAVVPLVGFSCRW
ncbi:MAG: hypothetical protein DYG96_10465 [Chlorobi bacterium CHB2]|nr:hypothetical protein [Chlorobi bacterium CHB2]